MTDGGKQGMGKKVAMMSDDERMHVINGSEDECGFCLFCYILGV